MEKITPCLWIVYKAEEAAELYVSTFKNSKIKNVARHNDEGAQAASMPKGSAMVVDLELCGQSIQLLNGGPNFEHTPSVSLFVTCTSKEEVDSIFSKLSPAGKVQIELGSYPFSERYVFFSDKFGVHWQLIYQKGAAQSVIPSIIFGGAKKGIGPQALEFYLSLFKSSRVVMDERYKKNEGGKEGSIKHARLILDGSQLVIMDSGHDFPMNITGAISFTAHCKDQEEVDFLWDQIGKAGNEIQCGWIQDQFGIFWQIIPNGFVNYIVGPDPQGSARAMAAMLKMKKLDIHQIRKAYEGK